MLVTADQLSSYGIDSELWFSARTGAGEPLSRDQYFINYPAKLKTGIYCAIGSNEDGWELELFNGVNWVVVTPDKSYKLIVTSAGLKALTNTIIGGYKLTISGVKIIDKVVINPSIPFIEWTDEVFLSHGNVKFSVGTIDAHNGPDERGFSQLRKILSWKYNTSSGGLQYCLDLPVEGLGAISDQGEEEWDVGTIAFYVKDSDGVKDILFGIGSLPSIVRKYANNINRIGNRLKFYFNTVLSNLGYVSNLEVMEDGNMSLPEVPNETLLMYPQDNKRRPYNCYLVDNLFGSNTPALAVPRPLNSEDFGQYINDWAYFQPSSNFLPVNSQNFAPNVQNYNFVYWNSDNQRYELAEGRYINDDIAPNKKMPIGVRVGDNIIYTGEITNFQTTYKYTVNLYNGGVNYSQGDELNIIVTDQLIIKVVVNATDVDKGGVISNFELVGPSVGSIDIGSDTYVVQSAVYDNHSPLPRNGSGARFRISAAKVDRYIWDFGAEELNKPVYCDKGTNAGKPTTTQTDCFLGWISGQNSIRLALDLRNEASETSYGTTRYATSAEVRNVVPYGTPGESTSVNPRALYENYIQKSKPSNSSQEGYDWRRPIEVYTKIHFNEMILGRSIKPQPNTTNYEQQTSHWDDENVDFWGRALRAEWADLAEYYESDEIYQPGTLISFGNGEKEITKAQFEADGVISSKPGLQLGSKKSDNYLPVAMVGRVPVMMDGNSVNYFGDKIYLSRVRPGMASTIKNGKCLGKIIDKNPGTKRLVECVVRIDFND